MKRSELRLSRPLYEGLPWLYVLCGIGALALSYSRRGGAMSTVFGVVGIAAVIGGIVILLRRRDYRDLRTQYHGSDSTLED